MDGGAVELYKRQIRVLLIPKLMDEKKSQTNTRILTSWLDEDIGILVLNKFVEASNGDREIGMEERFVKL